MTKAAPDDYEAVRAVVAALQPFDAKDQERILRWAKEKLGLPAAPTLAPIGDVEAHPAAPSLSNAPNRSPDIKTFIDNKNPQTDNQFAAAVAYYYRFEAPPAQRKENITKEDLQEACRKIGRERLKHPAQTLVNAHSQGYLDRGSERGTYAVNTVGENLVAMALPETAKGEASAGRTRRSVRRKRSSGHKRAKRSR
jgi:hypothetical protein